MHMVSGKSGGVGAGSIVRLHSWVLSQARPYFALSTEPDYDR